MMIEVRPSTMRFKRVAHAQFGFRIDARRGFVQNQVARVVRQRAREADQLLLAGGKAAAALANGMREALGQARG